MAERKIDYDLGVRKFIHPSGVEVYMYVDNPGVYLNAYENPLSEAFAAEAGYDIAALAKSRLRKEMLKKAHDGVLAQLAEDDAGTHEVLANRGGVYVVNIGLGRFVLEDQDGGRLSPTHMSQEAALDLLDKMVPDLDAKKPSPAKGVAPKA